MLFNNITGTIGKTPLVKLTKASKESGVNVYAKVEGFNPTGSIKDRTALFLIKGALQRGDISEGSTVIESSSGNLGKSLSMLCCQYGLQFLCVTDPKATTENIKFMQAFGTTVEVVEDPDETCNYLQKRIERVRVLFSAIKNSYWPNQYANIDNMLAHYMTTMPEIVADIPGHLHHFLAPVSTTGTIMGCAKYARENHLNTRIVAVDAVGSIIFGGDKKPRSIPGHGAARIPELFNRTMIDDVIYVSDHECVDGCRRFLRDEGLLVGGSSGGVYMAALSFIKNLQPGENVALVFPDRGDFYLSTIYSDSWVRNTIK